MKKGRTFWRWLKLWWRASVWEEYRKKRIIRENLESWNRSNRRFIDAMERNDNREIDRMCNGGPSSGTCDTTSITANVGGNGGF